MKFSTEYVALSDNLNWSRDVHGERYNNDERTFSSIPPPSASNTREVTHPESSRRESRAALLFHVVVLHIRPGFRYPPREEYEP